MARHIAARCTKPRKPLALLHARASHHRLHETAQVENPFFDFAGNPYTMAMALQNSFVHVPRKDKSDRLTHICELLAKHCKPHQHITLTILLVHLRSVYFGCLRRSPNTLPPPPCAAAPSHPPPSLPLALPPAGAWSAFDAYLARLCFAPASEDAVHPPAPQSLIMLINRQQGYTWADVPLASPELPVGRRTYPWRGTKATSKPLSPLRQWLSFSSQRPSGAAMPLAIHP